MQRGILIRGAILEKQEKASKGKAEEKKGNQESWPVRVFTSNLKNSASDYCFDFLINLLTSCSHASCQPEVAGIILDYMLKLKSEGLIEDKAEYGEHVVQRLNWIRSDV